MSDTSADAKIKALKARNVLNPHPETVASLLFSTHSFFDRHDLVQVKYEMLRQVQKDDASVTDAARDHGFSRVSFYEARASFEQEGLAGLVPQKRGPKAGHKLTPPIVEALLKTKKEHPSWSAVRLREWLIEQFQLTVHVRSVERVLAKQKKP